jgi:nucleotide-binding universal stress UspA family protein
MSVFSKILVPVEYSEPCRDALELAAELAAPQSAALVVLHAWEVPTYVSDHVSPGGHSLFDMVRQRAEEEMKTFLAGAKLPGGVSVETRIESGEPAHVVLDAIRENGCDLVVLSTHGRTGLSHVVLGSIAEKIVRLSPVPVLTVPSRGARKAS